MDFTKGAVVLGVVAYALTATFLIAKGAVDMMYQEGGKANVLIGGAMLALGLFFLAATAS